MDAVETLRAGRHILAGIAFRRVLELATHDLDDKGVKSRAKRTLHAAIEDAAKQNRIPAEMRRLAQHIRLLGNEAAHAYEAINEEEAVLLQRFSYLFLVYTFTLPKQIAEADESRQRKVAATPG